jgi:hypothetical protein
MPALTAPQTASALARLEGLHTMLTLDEAIELLTGKKPPLRPYVTTRGIALVGLATLL